jgi:hypothetical protein
LKRNIDHFSERGTEACRKLKSIPQGLRPSFLQGLFGTTEVVPCYKAGACWESGSALTFLVIRMSKICLSPHGKIIELTFGLK